LLIIATLLVTECDPPMPSTWISCGEPMTDNRTASRVGASAGRSESLKNGPRDVPPRMMTQGIRVCM
jgi:hypothetical protein